MQLSPILGAFAYCYWCADTCVSWSVSIFLALYFLFLYVYKFGCGGICSEDVHYG